MAEPEPVEPTELEKFKLELTTFLRESTDALQEQAKRMPTGTLADRNLALEKVHSALAFINLAALIENGAFDG